MELILILVVVLSVGMVIAIGVAQSGKPPAIGAMAPTFSVADEQGVVHTLDSLGRGWRVLLFYPQDTTPECREAITVLAEYLPRLSAAQVGTCAVAVADSAATAMYRTKHNVPVPVLCDADGQMSKRYGLLINFGVVKLAKKTLVAIGPDGKVAAVAPVIESRKHLSAALEAVLKRARGGGGA